MADCPICGGHLPDEVITILADRGEIHFRDSFCHFSALEMKLFMTLYYHRPRAVPKSLLLDELYGFNGDDPDQHILTVFVCHIRKKLAKAKIAIEIDTVWGRGWALRIADRVTLLEEAA